MAKNKGVLGNIAAAVVGVAVGATAMILSDKKNRKAIMKKVDEVVKEGEEKLEEGVKMVEGAMGKKSKKSTSKPKTATRKTSRKSKTGK